MHGTPTSSRFLIPLAELHMDFHYVEYFLMTCRMNPGKIPTIIRISALKFLEQPKNSQIWGIVCLLDLGWLPISEYPLEILARHLLQYLCVFSYFSKKHTLGWEGLYVWITFISSNNNKLTSLQKKLYSKFLIIFQIISEPNMTNFRAPWQIFQGCPTEYILNWFLQFTNGVTTMDPQTSNRH